jgi:hypothetical protein
MEIDRRAKILILHGLIYHLPVIDFSLTYITHRHTWYAMFCQRTKEELSEKLYTPFTAISNPRMNQHYAV